MSARMKDFKQLMKIGDLTMAERVVVNFRQAGVNDIVMVTGYQGKKLEKELRHLGTTFLRNDDYETTQMFDSAKIGFTYLKDRCDRILFCPADVPFSWMRPWMNCLSMFSREEEFFRTRNGNFAETHRVPGFGQGGVPEDGHFL
ncbi:hypothetical protein IMSAGC020_02480 [Lachnospiraceae bacterium]|nr:hypothetical protein IMSAGC020_02480 [Lachnospiraceae bacterium]